MSDTGPAWLVTMNSLDGTQWAPGDGKNPTILSWLNFIGEAYPGMKSYCDSAAAEDYFSWCGLTVGYCMAKNGLAPVFGTTDTSRFLWAAAWMGWGTPVSTPQPGDVVIFDFGGSDHHVTLFVKDNGNGTWSCHGGNQGHQVTLSNFFKTNVMGIRRPVVAATPTVESPSVIPAASPGSQRFTACVALVLQDEGGNDDDPRDPGGRTSRGITQGDWNNWLTTHPSLPADVWQAPQDQIVAIYHDQYWAKVCGDSLPAGVDYAVFDYGVLQGVPRASRALQGFVGAAVDGEIGPQTIAATAGANVTTLINSICDERITQLQQTSDWPVYSKGWMARVARVRAAALAMAHAAATAPPQTPPVTTPPPPQSTATTGGQPMTPDQIAQIISSILTALGTPQAGQPAATPPASPASQPAPATTPPANQPPPAVTLPAASGLPAFLQQLQSLLPLLQNTGSATQKPATTTPTAPIDLSQALQQLQNLVQVVQSLGGSSQPTDPISLIERLLPLFQKTAAPASGTTTTGTAPTDQLKQIANVISAILGQTGTPALGQVNGALGDTIGNLLNGKKTAIGIGGSLLTSLLGAIPAGGTGGLAGLLSTVATAVPGLSGFTLPIFLAMTAWGVLGKMEKWSQGNAPPPTPQS